jgi:hypothetical protein
MSEPRLPLGAALAWIMIAALICWAAVLAVWFF